jgi:predicted DCC family thiol-disulfide oxidoreductase YuxK
MSREATRMRPETAIDLGQPQPNPAAGKATAAEVEGPIVFFDGVCGLCNHFVDFVLNRDHRGVFRFAPLQGETARRHLAEADVRDLKTMVLLDRDGVFRKSTAVLRVLSRLGGGWRLLAALLRLIPRPLRDIGYAVVARTRYSIFGRKETCRMPTPAERGRLLP